MFKNYIVIALRNLLRNKAYSVINLVGLAIGMACTLLILLWVQDELSYERHHANADHIYQAYLKGTSGEDINFQSTTSPAIAGILTEEYPEILSAARLGSPGELVMQYGDKTLLETEGMAADPSVFDIFSYPLLQGQTETPLADPYAIVLTEDFAHKYFGDANPIDQIIKINGEFDFRVTAVMQNLPASAYRKFDFVLPFSFLEQLGHDIYGRMFYPCRYLTYVLVDENTDYEELNQKVSTRLLSEGKEIKFEIALVPLTETYLLDTGGPQRIYSFAFIALIILVLAGINFMNLATARSMRRSREIGIRKVAGALRVQIIRQFLGESLLLTFIASLFALFLTEIFLIFFNDYTAKHLAIRYTDPSFLAAFFGIVVTTGLLSGIYPAVFLSTFRPIQVLKNSLSSGSGKTRLRKSLVVLQFALSIFFIICTIIISQQTRYFRNFDLGMNIDNTLYVRLEGDILQKTAIVKNELRKHPDIAAVCTASRLPNAIRSGSYFQWGLNDDHPRRICYTHVDYDYLETFGLTMAAGRFYDKGHPTDRDNALIVNEAAIAKVALESPVNQLFYYGDEYANLIGVV